MKKITEVEQISLEGTQHDGGNFTGLLHLEPDRQLTEVNLVIAGSSDFYRNKI